MGRRVNVRRGSAQYKEIGMSGPTVQINPEIFRRVKEFIHASHAFKSVDEYVNFMLETLFLPEEQILSTEEQEILSERLRALGYLD